MQLSGEPPIPARARRRQGPHSWPTPSLPCRPVGRRKASAATCPDTCCPRPRRYGAGHRLRDRGSQPVGDYCTKRAVVYLRHRINSPICPASCGAFFCVRNWCYGGSQSGPRRGFTLGEKALEPLAGNPPGMGRAEAIAPTARAAPDFHALLRDTEQLRDLTGRIVVELELHYALSINFGERRESAARIYRWLLAGRCQKCWGGAASGGTISLKRFRGAA